MSELETRLREQQQCAGRWIRCFCLVDFDLSLGQVVEQVYPADALEEDEKRVIANIAFPDANSGSIQDILFTFKVRCEQTNGSCETLYGVSFFRQTEDASRSRGYFQKAAVVLSRHPFFSLFQTTMSIVGPLFFTMGPAVLEAACGNISSWPAPESLWNRFEDLPLMGEVILFQLSDAILSSTTPLFLPEMAVSPPRYTQLKVPGPLSQGSCAFINLYTELRCSIHQLWTLWELMITGESIMVFGNSPQQCSQAVLALVSLITPLPYQGQVYPYMTIMHPDFPSIEDRVTHDVCRSTVIGVTSPFFLKRFRNFPNVLLLENGDELPSMEKNSRTRKVSMDTSVLKASHQRDTMLTSRGAPQLLLQKKSLLTTNKQVVSQLLQPQPHLDSRQMNQINGKLLRDHFTSLTTRFLLPFEDYCTPSEPSMSQPYPYLSCAKYASFNISDISEIDHHPALLSQLSLNSSPQSSMRKLYSSFVQSQHLTPWLNSRRNASIQYEDQKMVERAEHIDKIVKDCSTKQLQDMLLTISDCLQRTTSMHAPSRQRGKILEKLQSDLSLVSKVLQQR